MFGKRGVTNALGKASRREQIVGLLSGYADQGRNLKDMPRLIGRSLRTLKKYCREAYIRFPDYVSREMQNENKIPVAAVRAAAKRPPRALGGKAQRGEEV